MNCTKRNFSRPKVCPLGNISSAQSSDGSGRRQQRQRQAAGANSEQQTAPPPPSRTGHRHHRRPTNLPPEFEFQKAELGPVIPQIQGQLFDPAGSAAEDRESERAAADLPRAAAAAAAAAAYCSRSLPSDRSKRPVQLAFRGVRLNGGDCQQEVARAGVRRARGRDVKQEGGLTSALSSAAARSAATRRARSARSIGACMRTTVAMRALADFQRAWASEVASDPGCTSTAGSRLNDSRLCRAGVVQEPRWKVHGWRCVRAVRYHERTELRKSLPGRRGGGENAHRGPPRFLSVFRKSITQVWSGTGGGGSSAAGGAVLVEVEVEERRRRSSPAG